MKMYILVKDDVPENFVPVIASHASLACYLKYEDDDNMKEWLMSSFKKCVVSVNEKEFTKAKEFDNSIVLTESALEGREVAIVLSPRPVDKFPKAVRFYKLWKVEK